MNTNGLTLALAPFVALIAGGASGMLRAGPDEHHQGLVRVQTDDSDDAEGAEFDRKDWQTRLSSRDLERRERDFDRMVDLARSNTEARAALEDWSKSTSDAELAWTSRLALREVERRGDRGFGVMPHGWQGQDFGRLHSRMDDLERHFGDMQWFFGDMQNELQQLFQNHGNTWHFAPGQGQGQSRASSFSLKVEPDGVTCEVYEDVDGKQEKREYKAKTMEELLEANPELKDRIGISGTDGQWFAPGYGGRVFRFGEPGAKSSGARAMAPGGAPRTDILGIVFSKLAPDEARELGLDPELGLHVDSVTPGTIAHILGIKRGDLVIELNGTPLYGAQDVSKTLGARAKDADVAVVLIDKKGQRRTLTWKPTANGEDSSKSKDEARSF